MPYLNEACTENFECQIRAGENAICRAPPGLCKCRNGFYIEHQEDSSTSCAKRQYAKCHGMFKGLIDHLMGNHASVLFDGCMWPSFLCSFIYYFCNVPVDAEGFRVFPNLKSKGKEGLYFKLVFLNMNFEQASNHCIEVSFII